MKYKVFVFLFISTLAACGNSLNNTLVGNWTAINITEKGEVLNVNYSEVRLHIRPDGSYIYNSTLRYEEKGTWKVKKNLLLTKDSSQNSIEKAVLVSRAAQDTLILEMIESGKSRQVTMIK